MRDYLYRLFLRASAILIYVLGACVIWVVFAAIGTIFAMTGA